MCWSEKYNTGCWRSMFKNINSLQNVIQIMVVSVYPYSFSPFILAQVHYWRTLLILPVQWRFTPVPCTYRIIQKDRCNVDNVQKSNQMLWDLWALLRWFHVRLLSTHSTNSKLMLERNSQDKAHFLINNEVFFFSGTLEVYKRIQFGQISWNVFNLVFQQT